MNQNIPDGCIPFDFDKYRAGHPARTRGGKGAKFAAYSPTHPIDTSRVVSILDDGTWMSNSVDGAWTRGTDWDDDIFLVAPEPTSVPWSHPDEIPDGVWFRLKGSTRADLITRVDGVDVYINPWVSLRTLFDNYECHHDRRHKGPWNVCGKEEVQ